MMEETLPPFLPKPGWFPSQLAFWLLNLQILTFVCSQAWIISQLLPPTTVWLCLNYLSCLGPVFSSNIHLQDLTSGSSSQNIGIMLVDYTTNFVSSCAPPHPNFFVCYIRHLFTSVYPDSQAFRQFPALSSLSLLVCRICSLGYISKYQLWSFTRTAVQICLTTLLYKNNEGKLTFVDFPLCTSTTLGTFMPYLTLQIRLVIK